MTTPVNVGDDNLAHQIMEAMDSIRAQVWHDPAVQPHWRDRLTDTAGLRAQQQHLAQFVRPVRGVGRKISDENWDTRLAEIFDDADYDFLCWQRELEFQRQWIIAASSARALGHVDFSRRLARVYRLLYGGDLSFEPVDDPLVMKPHTVFAVARRLQLSIYNWPINYLEWDRIDMQDFDVTSERISDRQRHIYSTLEKLDLVDNPCRSEIGRQLDAAYRASAFRDTLNETDRVWLDRITSALDAPDVSLASALMRLYAHLFGTVYIVGGLFLDQPPLGNGHVPDDPTEQQAKRCLLECNRLRAAWIN